MKICHVCKAECEDFAELCPVCGADLADVVEEEVIEETDEILLKDPVLLVSVEDVVSAEIFKDILKENNIVFTCEEKDNGGAMQVLFGGGFVYISRIKTSQNGYNTVIAYLTHLLISEVLLWHLFQWSCSRQTAANVPTTSTHVFSTTESCSLPMKSACL